jgi:hypothetical protein
LLGGYRDIGMKLQIGFTLMANGDVKFVPCCQWSDKSSSFKVLYLSFLLICDYTSKNPNHCFAQVKFMVVELQLRLKSMIAGNFKELHARYVECRDLLSL